MLRLHWRCFYRGLDRYAERGIQWLQLKGLSLSSHHDPLLKRVDIPIGRRGGRQVNGRDKLMGIAFIAVLLLALWWAVFKQDSYAV